jgi:hypothetical protein
LREHAALSFLKSDRRGDFEVAEAWLNYATTGIGHKSIGKMTVFSKGQFYALPTPEFAPMEQYSIAQFGMLRRPRFNLNSLPAGEQCKQNNRIFGRNESEIMLSNHTSSGSEVKNLLRRSTPDTVISALVANSFRLLVEYTNMRTLSPRSFTSSLISLKMHP